ncbi:MAG: hypothetical protein EBU54_02235 [Mycobacteriaceae bacterium]|nr:hypothetical protein [Mycobacteriaceae bacterium]
MKHLSIAILLFLPLLANAADLNLPLLPAEAKIIQGIAATEGVEVVLGAKPGWSARGAEETLASLGVAKDDIASVTVQSKEREALAFTVTHDKAGHVLAITGNGYWLRNSTLRSFKALRELRIIRMDHNGFVGNDPRIPEFDGSGFDALADSKLADIKIGLSFSDKGMEQCAKIKSLRSFGVAHSRVTDAGVAFFAGHPGLTSFSVSEMGKPLLTGKALASIAKIPNVNKIGFGECYITYTDGFAHLAPLKDKLVEFNITMSIASPADLDKFKADHPNMKITGLLTPEEIVKRHSGAAANIAKKAPPELAAPLNAAIEQFRKK